MSEKTQWSDEVFDPCFAVAKIRPSEDPWNEPIKDGTAIARRFRVTLGIEAA